VGDEGARTLGAALEMIDSLCILRLARCGIGDVGCVSLSEGALKRERASCGLSRRFAGHTHNSQRPKSESPKSDAKERARASQPGEDNKSGEDVKAGGSQNDSAESLAVTETHPNNTTPAKREAPALLEEGFAIPPTPAAAELNLTGNEINDDGTEELAWALKINNALTDLSLGYNVIGDQGCEAPNAAALQHHRSAA
jgi:hypothetical protein